MSTDALYTVRARQKALVDPPRALERCAAGVRAEAEAFFAAFADEPAWCELLLTVETRHPDASAADASPEFLLRLLADSAGAGGDDQIGAERDDNPVVEDHPGLWQDDFALSTPARLQIAALDYDAGEKRSEQDAGRLDVLVARLIVPARWADGIEEGDRWGSLAWPGPTGPDFGAQLERCAAETARPTARSPERVRFCGQQLSSATTRVSCDRARDLAPLAELPELSLVDLRGSDELVDIAPLGRLERLRNVDLSHTAVADITPLAPLSGLQQLRLAQSRVSRLPQLAAADSLAVLDLGYLELDDLGALAGLKRLRELSLSWVPLAAAAPLAELAALEALDLSGTKIEDLGPLGRLQRLRRLDLSFTPVRDLGPLAALGQLRGLKLMDCPVASIAPLAELEQLEVLDLSGTAVADLQPLAKARALRELNLKGLAQLEGIEPLLGLEALEHVDLKGTALDEQAISRLWRSSQRLTIRRPDGSHKVSLQAMRGFKKTWFPKELIKAAIDRFDLQPGPGIGRLKKELERAVERDELEIRRDLDYYLDYLDEHPELRGAGDAGS
jgi:hypothetical protein